MAGFRQFQTGEVLTAANVNDFLMKQSVMVFDDATARTSSLGAEVVEGMLTFNKDTGALEVFDGTDFVGVGGAVKEKRVDAFTGSGTFTVPAGVTYAIAHMLGGGGGSGGRQVSGSSASAGTAGGDTTVVLGALTLESKGAVTGSGGSSSSSASTPGLDAHPNTGRQGSANFVTNPRGTPRATGDSTWIVAGFDCSPGDEVAITVGAGGIGTGANVKGGNGGSGYVYIEYFEEA